MEDIFKIKKEDLRFKNKIYGRYLLAVIQEKRIHPRSYKYPQVALKKNYFPYHCGVITLIKF